MEKKSEKSLKRIMEDYETCCHFLRHEKTLLSFQPSCVENMKWFVGFYNNETIYFGAHNGNPAAWNHVYFLGVWVLFLYNMFADVWFCHKFSPVTAVDITVTLRCLFNSSLMKRTTSKMLETIKCSYSNCLHLQLKKLEIFCNDINQTCPR